MIYFISHKHSSILLCHLLLGKAGPKIKDNVLGEQEKVNGKQKQAKWEIKWELHRRLFKVNSFYHSFPLVVIIYCVVGQYKMQENKTSGTVNLIPKYKGNIGT